MKFSAMVPERINEVWQRSPTVGIGESDSMLCGLTKKARIIMTRSGKTAAIVLSLALTAAALTGCGSSGSAGGSTQAAGTDSALTGASAIGDSHKEEIHIILAGSPTHLDIAMTTEDVAAEVAQGTIFEQLVVIDEIYMPVPELAESIDVSEDKKEYVYHLRKDVKFHNGEEMKAADVAASMNRWVEAASNAKSMVGEAVFEVVDDYTVKISMDAPCAYLNELIAGLGQRAAIMPKSVIDRADPQTGIVKEYIGTGPYKLEVWESDQYIRLVRFEDYSPYGTDGEYSGWAGYKHAYTPTVYYDIVSDPGTIMAGLQTGEYDAATEVSYDNYDLFANDENFQVHKTIGEEAMLIFNKKEGLGADEKIRQAVQAALKLDDIMLAAYSKPEFYELYSSYMFKEQTDWYSEEGSEYFNQNDPERAKELLAEAGYSGEPFKLLVSTDNQDFYKMAVVIKSQLEAAGMNCELLTYDWSTFVGIRNNEPENYSAFITSFAPKIIPTMNLYLSSSWAGWCEDEKIIEGLSSINTDSSKENAVKTWNELQKYMNETSVPVVKLGSKYNFMVCKAGFDGLEFFERPLVVNARLYE